MSSTPSIAEANVCPPWLDIQLEAKNSSCSDSDCNLLVYRILAAILSTDPWMICSGIDQLFVIEKQERAHEGSFVQKIQLLDQLSVLYCERKSDMNSLKKSIGSAIGLWRRSLSPTNYQSLTFRKALLKWIQQAPELFLGMFFNDNHQYEGLKFVYQDPQLLEVCLLQENGFVDLFMSHSAKFLSTAQTSRQSIEILNYVSNFLIHLVLKDSTISFTTEIVAFWSLVEQHIRQRWVTTGAENLDHLLQTFSTLKSVSTNDNKINTISISTSSFYLADDFEVSLYILGLLLLAFEGYNEISSSVFSSTIDQQQTLATDSLVFKVRQLWSIGVNCVRSLALEVNSLPRVAQSVSMHTALLLRLWSLTSAIEKIFCIQSVKNYSEELQYQRQCIQALKFLLTYSLKQLKYMQLFLGSGSLTSITSSRDTGNMFSGAKELYEDSVSRYLLEQENHCTLAEQSETQLMDNVSVGVVLPLHIATHQFEASVQNIIQAKTSITPLLARSLITDINENSIYDDLWWEISLSAMIASCHTLQESTAQEMQGASIGKVDYPSLLKLVYTNYQALVSQDQQDNLKRVILKVRRIREAAQSDKSTSIKQNSSEYPSILIQKAMSTSTFSNNRSDDTYIGTQRDDSENDDRIADGSKFRLRRALSLSTTKKRFASSLTAKKVAAKLISHPHESFLSRVFHNGVVLSRPPVPEGEEGTTPLYQPLNKLFSLSIQELLWSLRSEWLELLSTIVKATLNDLLGNLSHSQSVENTAFSLPESLTGLFKDMLQVFSAELMHSATVGVSKVVFENTIEVLYAVSRALYPEDRVLPLQNILQRSQTLEVTSTSDLARALVVLQEVGASADPFLQRALLNLTLQLSAADILIWKVTVPFLMQSCIKRWTKMHFQLDDDSDDNSEADESHADDDSDDSNPSLTFTRRKVRKRRKLNNDDEEDPLQSRKVKIAEQVDLLDVYLQQKVVELQNKDEHKDSNCMIPEISIDLCYLKFDNKVAESLWMEIMRRLHFEIKSAMQIVQSPELLASVAREEVAEMQELFIASRQLQLYVGVYLSLCGTLFIESPGDQIDRCKNDEHEITCIWDILTWKCKLPFFALTELVIRSLGQDARRVLKSISISPKDPTAEEKEVVSLPWDSSSKFESSSTSNEYSNTLQQSFGSIILPIICHIPFQSFLGSTEYAKDDIESGTNLSFSRIPFLFAWISEDDSLDSIKWLMLLRQILIRKQFVSQQQLVALQENLENNQGHGKLKSSPARNVSTTRSPTHAVAHLLGLNSTSNGKSSNTKASSPSRSQKKNSAHNLQINSLAAQVKRYGDTLSKFITLENDFRYLVGRFENFANLENLDFLLVQNGAQMILDALESMKSHVGSPDHKKRKHNAFSLEEESGEDENPDEYEMSKRQKLINRSLARVTKNKTLNRGKAKSRNQVVNSWLKETDGNDAYADLEDFLV